MKFIETLDYYSLVDLISESKHRLCVSLPGIDEKLAEALISHKDQAQITVLVDNSESTIRRGYGDIKAIEKLREAGIHLNECNGNFISFIISDDIGFFIFPESRIFSDDPQGPNAVKIDPVTIQLLCFHYFPSRGAKDEFAEGHTKALNRTYLYFEKTFEHIQEEGIEVESKDFDQERFNTINQALKINQPIQPDIRRILEVYTTRFQYVELIAKNIKIGQHRAHMPEDSIPVQNKELRKRLISSIKAFENIERSIELLELGDLEGKVKDLRKDFLIPITCRNGKNLITKDRVVDFRVKVEGLNKEFASVAQKLKKVLDAEIEKTKEQVRNEWKHIFKQFPPEELRNMETKSEEYGRKLELILNRMIREIKFPPVDKIVTDFSLTAYYFELTWDDLKDDRLVEELCKKGVIEKNDQNQLADFKKAIAEKK